ncbi:MAG: LicD family protein [Clostridiales bacterium]|nr:LicD family protein [Clostridiales bacterium]
MTELQSKLLDMLKWFHSFCVEHDLRYYALGGTMLGAVRHKGFIPWDDDIDVGLPRADYNKFIELSDCIPAPYVLETPQSPAKEFVYAYSKLYNTDTTFIEKGKKNIKRGIFLDVFPIDGLGNDEAEALAQFNKTARLVKKLAVRVSPIRKGRGFAKNCAVALSRCVPQFIINDKKLAQKLDRVAAQKGYDQNAFVGNLVCNYKPHNILKREYFGTPTLYVFEDTEVYGAQDYEGYLSQVFGDWRKLPPEDQQVSLHLSSKIDLNKSYLDTGEARCKR